MILNLHIKPSKKRIFGLDILRAFAIIFVILEHGNNYLPENLKQLIAPLIFDGVSLFFVLSGYLVGKILILNIENKKTDFKSFLSFLKRRWFKTLPNYYLILVVLFLLNFFFNAAFSKDNLFYYFIFSQNLNTPHPPFFPEAWSLSIEEWFYLIVPVLVFIFIRLLKLSIRKSLLFIISSILLLVTYYRFQIYLSGVIENHGKWDILVRKQVFTRLDTIMYGVIGAYCHVYFLKTWNTHKNKLFTLGILLLIASKLMGFFDLNPADGIYQIVFSFSLTGLATLMILPFLSNITTSKGILYKWITAVSLISYAMYLLNLSVIQFWIIDTIDWSFINLNINVISFIKYFIYWGLTLILSILLYKFYEKPIMNLRDKKKYCS